MKINPSAKSQQLEPKESTNSNQTNQIDLNVQETTNQFGQEVISLVLPVSGFAVEIRKPTVKIMISIEREIVRHHKESGQLEQALVGLSKLICRWRDRTGENCVSYSQLEELEVADIMALNQASEIFFRQYQILS